MIRIGKDLVSEKISCREDLVSRRSRVEKISYREDVIRASVENRSRKSREVSRGGTYSGSLTPNRAPLFLAFRSRKLEGEKTSSNPRRRSLHRETNLYGWVESSSIKVG